MDQQCHRPLQGVIASAVMGATLLFGGPILAQSSQVLDEAARAEAPPTVVIPPSDGGTARTLVVHRPRPADGPLPAPPSPVSAAQSGGLRIALPPAGQPVVPIVGVFLAPASASNWLWSYSAYARPPVLPGLAPIRSPLLRGTPFIPAQYSVWRPIYRIPPVFLPGVASLYRLPYSLYDYRAIVRRPHGGLIPRRR